MQTHWWTSLPDETLKETAWERQMNVQGTEIFERRRYTAAGKPKDASDTSTGQSALQKLVLGAAGAIQKLQKSLIRMSRVERNLRATVISLPADTAALIVLRVLIDRAYGADNPEDGYGYQIMVTEVARAVEMELNFRHWISESKKAAKEYAKIEGMAKIPPSTAEMMIRDGSVNAKAVSRWKKTIGELNEYSWDTKEKEFCGDALLTAVIEDLKHKVGDDELPVFEKFVLTKMSKKTTRVRMHHTYRHWFDQREMTVARMQVLKKPMLTKPKPWRPYDA